MLHLCHVDVTLYHLIYIKYMSHYVAIMHHHNVTLYHTESQYTFGHIYNHVNRFYGSSYHILVT